MEGYFAKLSKQRLKRGVFRSVVDLQAAINRFVAETNAEPKPFVWTADPNKIIAAVKRGHQVLDSIYGGRSRSEADVRTDTCVYRKLKSERSDGEAPRGLGVNESFRPDESDEKSAHPCAETDVF